MRLLCHLTMSLMEKKEEKNVEGKPTNACKAQWHDTKIWGPYVYSLRGPWWTIGNLSMSAIIFSTYYKPGGASAVCWIEETTRKNYTVLYCTAVHLSDGGVRAGKTAQSWYIPSKIGSRCTQCKVWENGSNQSNRENCQHLSAKKRGNVHIFTLYKEKCSAKFYWNLFGSFWDIGRTNTRTMRQANRISKTNLLGSGNKQRKRRNGGKEEERHRQSAPTVVAAFLTILLPCLFTFSLVWTSMHGCSHHIYTCHPIAQSHKHSARTHAHPHIPKPSCART